MIEHERSYIFTHEGMNRFITSQNLSVVEETMIEDCYIAKDLRIRRSAHGGNKGWFGDKYVLTKKKGDKSKGYRFEEEVELPANAANILCEDADLVVSKSRFHIASDSHYKVTIDFCSSPMKLAILEIEADEEVACPLPLDICNKIFNTKLDLIECPLSAHSLFKRRIGICGGPSSGKSELAKIISHIMNTEYDGNSFHVTEFATSFIQKYNRNPQFLDQFFVWYGQREREKDANRSDIILSDCPTFLSYIYMLKMKKFDFSSQSAFALSKIYKRVLFDLQGYTDIIFLQIQNYKENNIRYQTEVEARDIERRIAQFLDDHVVPYMKATYFDHRRIFDELFHINTYPAGAS